MSRFVTLIATFEVDDAASIEHLEELNDAVYLGVLIGSDEAREVGVTNSRTCLATNDGVAITS